MRVTLDCGCTINDENLSTVHEEDGRHYPIGMSPKSFCKMCDLPHPAGSCQKKAAPTRTTALYGKVVARNEHVTDSGGVRATVDVSVSSYSVQEDEMQGGSAGGSTAPLVVVSIDLQESGLSATCALAPT